MFDVLVVEDDNILCDFLIQELSAHCRVPWQEVRSASTLAEGRAEVDRRLPDALLLDLHLPDGSGVDLASHYVSLLPTGRIVVLTGQIDQYLFPASLHSNVMAVLNKADGLPPLRDALWGLRSAIGTSPPDLSVLTPRQREMLRLIGHGRDTAEIAQLMGISFATAQTHRRQITGRLGVRGAELVNLARLLPFHHG